MMGPRRLIVLDGVPRDRWQIDPHCAVILYKRLWFIEDTKCAICIRAGEDTITFVTPDPQPIHHCVAHGLLNIYPFVVKRMFVVEIDGAGVQGQETFESSIYLPKEMCLPQRDALIQVLLAEAEAYEIARGAT